MKKKFILGGFLLLLLPLVFGAKVINVNEEDIIRLTPEAVDPDNDNLNYFFSEPFDEKGEWVPNRGDAGTYNISVMVTDGGYVIENIVVIVNSTNVPPTMQPIENITIREGETLIIPVIAKDANNDNLSVSISGWIDTFEYITKFEDAGIHTVTVVVSDGEFETSQDIFINVIDTNRAPYIMGPDRIVANEGDTIIIIPDAFDLDGDHISFTYSGWMDTNSYTTNNNDAGIHFVRVFADDDNLKSYKDIEIEVKNVNRLPDIVVNKSYIVNEGDILSILPIANDPDNDTITFSFDGLIQEDNAQIDFESAGEHEITITASDGYDLVLTTITVFVKDVNRAPEISPMDIYVSEGDVLDIISNATDPDGDELFYRFSRYADKSSTVVGFDDQGVKYVDVFVTDGEYEVNATYIIHITNVNRAPEIIFPDTIYINESDLLILEPQIIDGDGDEFNYFITGWTENKTKQTGYEDAGEYEIEILATDSTDFNIKKVRIVVLDVNRPPIFDFKQNEFNEGDIIDLNDHIVDPDGDSLTFIDSNKFVEGVWETDFYDAGDYVLNITASDEEFEITETVKISIRDIDRAPLFKPIEPITVYEIETVSIILDAIDQDGDELTYEVQNAPEGSNLKGNKFTWKPSYDVISEKSNSWLYRFLRKLGLVKEQSEFVVTFIATGKNQSTYQDTTITVVQNNRQPKIVPIETIEINEGDFFEIYPEVWDNDNDVITLSYSGWIMSNKYQTNYNDAGEYEIIVTASDGFLTDTYTVKVIVNDINRAPVITNPGKIIVNEGQTATTAIVVNEPDGDSVEIYSENLPNWAYIEGNNLVYPVKFDAVSVIEKVKKINFTLFAKDSKGAINSTVIEYELNHINQAPVIQNSEPSGNVVKVFQGGILDFSVDAFDPDGDNLTYTWKFDPLNSHIDGHKHSRRFVNTGKRLIKVIVSDGFMKAEKEWTVDVLPGKKVVKKTRKEPSSSTSTTSTQTLTSQITTTTIKKTIQKVAPSIQTIKSVDYQEINERYVITEYDGQKLENTDVYVI